MFGYLRRSHRSQTPSPQPAESATNERKAQEIEARYEVAIAQWSVEQDCEARDYTPDQLDRYEAFRIAGSDEQVAKRLVFGQMLYDTERIAG